MPNLITGIELPNKTVKERERVKQLLDAMKCDPFEILAFIALGDYQALGLVEYIEVGDRKDAAKELAGYLAPKLKAIEHTDQTKAPGGVMLIPTVGGLEEWSRMIAESKVKTVEMEKP